MHRAIVLLGLVVLCLSASAEASLDAYEDGVIDYRDLFLLALNWKTTDDEPALVQMVECWHKSAPVVNPIPTATPDPDQSAGLRLSACEFEAPVGREIVVWVDRVDGRGNPDNPNVSLGEDPIPVEVSFTGSAYLGLPGIRDSVWTIQSPMGLSFRISGATAETVMVTAEAPELAPAAPLTLAFTPSGVISGRVRHALGSEFVSAPITGVGVEVLHPQTGAVVASGQVKDDQGGYAVSGLPPGEYHVRFSPRGVFPGMRSLEAKCLSGVRVEAWKESEGVDADLDKRSGGGNVTGALWSDDGTALDYAEVILIPKESGDCRLAEHSTVANISPEGYGGSFSFSSIPPGRYRISSAAYGRNQGFYLMQGPVEVVVENGGLLRLQMPLSKLLAATPIRPVGYVRLSGAPVFEWEDPDESGLLRYTVEVLDRCGHGIWSQQGVEGETVSYPGEPQLPLGAVLTWNILGLNETGGVKAMFFGNALQPGFIVLE